MPRSSLVPVSMPSLPIRRRWSVAEARRVLKRLEVSGLTVREFAARGHLEVKRLYRWRSQLRGKHANSPAFVEITPSMATTTEIEVVLRSGHVVRVSNGFAEDTLRRVVEALEERVSRC